MHGYCWSLCFFDVVGDTVYKVLETGRFWFSAAYEGAEYSTDDEFMYRNREISMEEFEDIRDSIE